MAASDPVVSGKYGCAKKGDGGAAEDAAVSIFEVIAWQYSEQSADVNYASCETDGQRRRIDGSYDITGSITVVYNADNPFRSVLAPDDNVILYLYKRKASVGVTGKYDRIPAKILGISGGVNIDQAGTEQFEITFGLHTTTTAGDEAATFDNTVAALT